MTDHDERIQREIADLLAAQPRPELPAEVRQRIEAALADEATRRTVVDLSSRRRAPRWLLPAAGVAAAALIAAVVLVPMRGGGSSTSAVEAQSAPQCGIPLTESSDLSAISYASGTQYTTAGLSAQSLGLLDEQCPADPAAAEAPADLGLQDGQSQRSAPSGAPYHSGALATEAVAPGGVVDCLIEVLPQATVLAVDSGWYRNEQVLVTVVRRSPPAAVVVDCTPTPREMYRTTLG